MAINVFEGARRIAKLFAGLWIIGWIVAAFNVTPTINVTYKIAGPDAVPQRMTEECPTDSATETTFEKTKSGTKAWVRLCFLAMTSDSGERLIPYRIDKAKGVWWGAKEYSSDISEYKRRAEASFSFSQDDEMWIDSQWLPFLLKDLGGGALVAVIGLLIFWIFVWSVGWIMRGFMGIPRGQDSKV